MKELLEFEADKRALAITVNSFSTNLSNRDKRADRKALYCSFGSLYPEATMKRFDEVGKMEELERALGGYRVYYDLLQKTKDGSTSLLDQLLMHEVKLNRAAFDGQSHFAAFYAFVKLKTQEERNLRHIFSCIEMKRDPKDIRWISLFKG